MKRLAAVVAAFAALSLAAAAAAAPVTYVAPLTGAAENPSNASPGTGSATVTIDTVAHTMNVTIAFSGLTGTTTASHIHCCTAPPGNAGVATALPTFPGFPLGVSSGTYSRAFDLTQASSWNPAFVTANGGTTAGAEAALANGLSTGQAYLNVHTNVFPGGEIRGFLALAVAPGPIPTLTEWGLAILASVLALAAIGRLRERGR